MQEVQRDSKSNVLRSSDGEAPKNNKAQRWSIKDVLIFIIFNVIIILLATALRTLEDILLGSPQNSFFVGSWLLPLVITPFYLVMADRIGKRGVLGFTILVFGLFFSAIGGIWCLPVGIVAAVIGEIAMWGKQSYRKTSQLIGGFYIFWVAFACYGIIPYLFFRTQYEQQLSTYYSAHDVSAMVAQYTELPFIVVMLVLFAVGTLVGGLIGMKLLKKHVRKSKIA